MNPDRIRLDRASDFLRGEVRSLAAWSLLSLVCFVGHPAAADDAAVPSAGLAAQERARAIAAELVRGVIDAQLRQLEENGLADRPIHADILALRGTIDSLVQREMQEVIDLLGRADAALPAERREIIGEARSRARAIVTRLAAERQQVVRRLKEATLAAEARAVLDRQSRLLKATESLPTLPDGRREQAMLAAIEEERNVKTLLATLQASLADVSNWGGETGATGMAGLRELEKEGVAAAVAAAESRLAAADPAEAAAEQRRAIAGLESVLAAVEGNQAVRRGDAAAAGKDAAALADKAAAMRTEMAKVPLTDESVEKLLAEQSALQESLARLAEQARAEPAAAGLVAKAKEASLEAAAGLLEGDQKRALANQDMVIDSLEQLAARLEAGKPAAASAEAFARQAAELMKVLESVNGLSKRQEEIGRAAATQPQAVVQAERQVAAAVAKLLDDARAGPKPDPKAPNGEQATSGNLPAAVEQRLQMAAEAAANVAQAQSPQAAESALQAATEAMQSAAREIANAVADARRAELAAKAGELSRAAEVAERAAAAERGIAEAAKQAAQQAAKQPGADADDSTAEPGPSADHLTAKQAEVAAVSGKVEEAVEKLSPEAAKMIEAARAAMEAARKQLGAQAAGEKTAGETAPSAAGEKAPGEEPSSEQMATQKPAGDAAAEPKTERTDPTPATEKAPEKAAAEASARAAESLTQAAAVMREEAKKAADALAKAAAAPAAADKAAQAAARAAAQAAAESAAKSATEAAEALAKAAAAMREDAKKAAEELARTAAEQAAAAAKARAAAEQAAAEQSQAGRAAQQKSPRQPQSAANSPERQAESLAARETALARDRLLAEEIAAALEEQSSAREAVAASAKQLEQLPSDGASETAPDSAAAQNREAAAATLAEAKERFADAQRAVGERVADALDQQGIGNRPLRESLEEASREEDLGTGFVPESPETTADMIAGKKATAAAEQMLAAAGGQQQPGQDSQSGQPSDSEQARAPQSDQGRDGKDGNERDNPQGQQSPSQTAQNEDSQSRNSEGETSESTTARDEKSESRGSRTGEARDQEPPREIDAVDRQADAGSREGDTNLAERSFERDAWFAKLPPEVRKAIRAGSQRRAPRGYEEKMDRYFKNIE